MLILTRRVGESVVIDDLIYCSILGFRDDQVRLAMAAPRAISVHRDEIQRRIFRENRQQNWPATCQNDETILDRLIALKCKEYLP